MHVFLRRSAFALLMMLVCLIAVSRPAHACSVIFANDYSIFPWNNPFSYINQAIDAAVGRGEFRVDDFEKLDFSLPGSSAYGDNPGFEIFNRTGPFSVGAYPDWRQLKGTFSDQSQVVFILRTMTQDGEGRSLQDNLYGVITDVNEGMCRRFHGSNPMPLPGILDLTPSDKGAIVDKSLINAPSLSYITASPDERNPGWIAECTPDSSGKWYYLEFISMRSRHDGAAPWHTAPDLKPCTDQQMSNYGNRCTYTGWRGNASPRPFHANPVEFYKHDDPPAVTDWLWHYLRVSGAFLVYFTMLAAFGGIVTLVARAVLKRIKAATPRVVQVTAAVGVISPLLFVLWLNRFKIEGGVFYYLVSWGLACALIYAGNYFLLKGRDSATVDRRIRLLAMYLPLALGIAYVLYAMTFGGLCGHLYLMPPRGR